MSTREDVLEDVLKRIAEEHGVETMALDWAIVNEIIENEEPLPETLGEDA